MRTLFCLFCLLLLCACASNTPPEKAETKAQGKQVLNYAKADADYIALAQKIIDQNATLDDFDRVLKLFPLTSFYAPTDPLEYEVREASVNFMQEELWIPCLRVNRELINQNYTSLTGHYGMAICSQEAGDNQSAAFHNWVLDNYIEAIWRSGDGQTPENAFYINSAADLIAFVQLHQMQVTNQELIYVSDIPIQRVKVLNPENQRKYDWYFNMTPQFRRAYIDKLESK